MAIICSDLKLLFIQAPRTGCTAIEKLLIERFDGRSLPPADILDDEGFVRVGRKHCSLKQLLAEGLIEPGYEAHLTTVVTVRNPFDSLVSLYLKKREKYQERLNDPTAWVHRVRGYVEDMEYCRTHSFGEWLQKRYSVSRIDRLVGRGRRSLYGRYTAGVEVVMQFERLQQDFEAAMRKLGVQGDVTIPSVNATPQKTRAYQEYYTAESRRLIEYVFAPELEQYGYSFEGMRTATPSRTVA